MMNNPLNVVKRFIGQQGNPKELLINFMQQNNANPMINNLIQMAKEGNTQQVENFARNAFKEQGRNFDEEFDDIENKMNNILSDLEWKVLMSYLDGKSYQEIAEDLDRHIKSIDNALQRVKRKLEKYIISRGDITDLRTVYSGLLAIDPTERFHNKK